MKKDKIQANNNGNAWFLLIKQIDYHKLWLLNKIDNLYLIIKNIQILTQLFFKLKHKNQLILTILKLLIGKKIKVKAYHLLIDRVIIKWKMSHNLCKILKKLI